MAGKSKHSRPACSCPRLTEIRSIRIQRFAWRSSVAFRHATAAQSCERAVVAGPGDCPSHRNSQVESKQSKLSKLKRHLPKTYTLENASFYLKNVRTYQKTAGEVLAAMGRAFPNGSVPGPGRAPHPQPNRRRCNLESSPQLRPTFGRSLARM